MLAIETRKTKIFIHKLVYLGLSILDIRKIYDSDYDNNFPHKLLLTNTQVSKHCQAFANSSSANVKLSKTPLYKTKQFGGFLGRLLGPLQTTDLPLIENGLRALFKNVLITLGLTATTSATDAAISKKMFGSGTRPRVLASRPSDLAKQTTLIVSNEEINDIMKIVFSRIWFINKRC